MASDGNEGEEQQQKPLTFEVGILGDLDHPMSLVATTGEDASLALVISDRPSKYTRQEPIAVLVGPDACEFFIHPGLAAAKSPFFRAKLKDCWHQNGGKTELPDVSSSGFGIVVDWMYTGQLPHGIINISDDERRSSSSLTPDAFKAADVLMMVKLQNELICNEAALFLKHRLGSTFEGLRDAYDAGLHHTKYYQFLLKSTVKHTMVPHHQNSEKWDEAIKGMGDRPEVLIDLLRSTRMWIQKPWNNFPDGDLAEFLTTDPCDQSVTTT